MRKLTAVAVAAALGVASQANAAIYTGSLTIVYGDTSSDGLPLGDFAGGGATPVLFDSQFRCEDASMAALGYAPNFCFVGNFDSSGDRTWTSSGPNSLSQASLLAGTYYNAGGSNGTSYYNPNSQFDAGGPFNEVGIGQSNCAASSAVNDFSCAATVGKSQVTFATAVDGVGPSAVASGSVTIDTVAGTLTGSLSVSPYSYRFADGSPFPNGGDFIGYYGAGATLTLNFTGSFSDTAWNITGGGATFNDPGLGCFPLNVLCFPGTILGSHQNNGSHLSWSPFNVCDLANHDSANNACTSFAGSVPGVIGSASLSGGATTSITSATGEFHRAGGNTSGGCTQFVVSDSVNSVISCGSTTAGLIVSMSGTFTEQVIPVPAAVWLFGSALGLLGWVRRRVS